MPSRRKKALRDSSLTHTFFNQTNGNVCTCGAEHNHNHATSSTNFAGLDASKYFSKCGPTKTDHKTDTEKFRHAMSSLWTERYNKLTTEERQRLNAAIAAQPTISDPYSVLRVLKDAHKLMNDLGTTPDEVPPMETFDLDNLEEVAETYDELCQKYKDEEEREMANLAGLISNSASIASDTTRSAEDRLAAELDMHNLNIHSKIIVPLTSCLRQAQLFNVEKKFGFPEEDYEALSNDDKKRRGEDVPVELPLSFRQTWNNPFKPLDPASKPSKKKGKKKLSGLEVLAELQCNCNRATEDMQNIGKTIRCAAESTELPSLAPSITYADVPVPEDIPDHVRQRFSDAEFAFQEVLVLQGEASKQLLNVRSAFVAWNSASREVWYVCFEVVPSV